MSESDADGSVGAGTGTLFVVDTGTGKLHDVGERDAASSPRAVADGGQRLPDGGEPGDDDPYRTLVENFPNGLATRFDRDLRYMLVGGTMFEQLSLDPEDLAGRTPGEVFLEENAALLEPLHRAALEGEQSCTELSFEGHDFRTFVQPLEDGQGDVVGGMTLSQDVTELRARERELEAARKRYRTLIETAPDAICVADAATGELCEVNEAAVSLFGAPREELVGRDQTALHPTGEGDRYRELFERHVDQGGTFERFDDGSPVEVVTDDGERVPVAISARTVELDDRTVVYGIFRDNSDRIAHERTLTELHGTTRTLLQARTRSDVSQGVVDAMRELFDFARVAVYRFDEKAGVLRPGAYDTEVDDPDISLPTFEPGSSVAWEAFVRDERVVTGADRATETARVSVTELRGELFVPLGDFGVLVAGATSDDAFDERTVELVGILARTARTAIERVATDERLRQREDELDRQVSHLERLEDANVQIRELTNILVQADSRREIEERVCDHLTDTDPIAFAWIGEPDGIDETLVPRAWAGEGRRYLDQISLSFPEGGEDGPTADLAPAVRTVLTGERTVVENAARDVSAGSWRNDLVTTGLLSAMSIPLTYNDAFYGVLTVYAHDSSAFDGMLRSVLGELADGVGYAINATYRKHALSADQVTELEFQVDDPACFFVRFAQETGYPIEFQGMIPEEAGSAIVFVEVPEASSEDVLTYAERATAIEEARVLEADDGAAQFQFRVLDPFVGLTLADQGISLRSIEADTDECRVAVTSPPTIEPRRVRDVMLAMFPDSELVAKRERIQPEAKTRGLGELYRSDLTERQRDVVTTAYRNGYFDSPKGASGTELAEEMGISPSAFHDNLRAAERKLLSSVVESSSAFDSGPG